MNLYQWYMGKAIQFSDTANCLRMKGVAEQVESSVAFGRYPTIGAAIRDMQDRAALYARLSLEAEARYGV